MSKTAKPSTGAGSEPLVPDPIELMRERGKSPELAGALAWLIPGAGHIYAGFLIKGLGGMVFVLGLFFWGLLLSRGESVSLRKEGGHEYAFLAQLGAGGPTLLGLAYNHEKIPGLRYDPPDVSDPNQVEAYAARLPGNDAGLLFTMIAGLLNLLLISDALNGVPGAMTRRIEEKRRERRLAALREELAAERAAAAKAAEPEAKATEPEPEPEPDKTEPEPDKTETASDKTESDKTETETEASESEAGEKATEPKTTPEPAAAAETPTEGDA